MLKLFLQKTKLPNVVPLRKLRKLKLRKLKSYKKLLKKAFEICSSFTSFSGKKRDKIVKYFFVHYMI